MEFLANIHPIVIHFPIVLLLIFALIELSNLYFRNGILQKYSLAILIVGIIGGIFSALTGNMSYQQLNDNSEISQFHIYLIEKHELFATLTLWYFIAILIFHFYIFFKKKNETRLQYLFVIFVMFGIILLYKTATIGGKLVYQFGIGTDLLK